MIRECLPMVVLLAAGIVVAKPVQAETAQSGLCAAVEELARYATDEREAPGGAATDKELLETTAAMIQMDGAYWDASHQERVLLEGMAAHVYRAIYSGEAGDPRVIKESCLARLKAFEDDLRDAHPTCRQEAEILHHYAVGREDGVSESQARAWLVLSGRDNAALVESAIKYVYRHAVDVPAAEVAQQGYVACLKESIGD